MAAALRAGIPQVPCPILLDQPHNANQIVRIGCAKAILPFPKLTKVDPLAEQVKFAFENEELQAKAKEIGLKIAQESDKTPEKFVQIITNYYSMYENKQQ